MVRQIDPGAKSSEVFRQSGNMPVLIEGFEVLTEIAIGFRYSSTVKMLPPSLKTERAKLDDFYAARSEAIPPLPWQTFPPPFSGGVVKDFVGLVLGRILLMLGRHSDVLRGASGERELWR